MDCGCGVICLIRRFTQPMLVSGVMMCDAGAEVQKAIDDPSASLRMLRAHSASCSLDKLEPRSIGSLATCSSIVELSINCFLQQPLRTWISLRKTHPMLTSFCSSLSRLARPFVNPPLSTPVTPLPLPCPAARTKQESDPHLTLSVRTLIRCDCAAIVRAATARAVHRAYSEDLETGGLYGVRTRGCVRHSSCRSSDSQTGVCWLGGRLCVILSESALGCRALRFRNTLCLHERHLTFFRRRCCCCVYGL